MSYLVRDCLDHHPQQFLDGVLLLLDVDGQDLEVVRLPGHLKNGLLGDLLREGLTAS